MNFWEFCGEVSKFVSDEVIITYLRTVRIKWRANKTVKEVVESIKKYEADRE